MLRIEKDRKNEDYLIRWFSNIRSSLLQKRSFLNGSYFEYFIIFLVFVILSIIYTNFIAFDIDHKVFTGGAGDATAGFLWYNFFDRSLNPFLNKNNFVNFPYGENMMGGAFITYIVLWLPLRLLSFVFGAVAGINLLTLLGFVISGLGAYLLVKRLTGSMVVSFFAGFATAFVPYNLYKSTEHIAFIFCVVFVLILAAFIALWSRPTRLRGVLFGLSIALAFYTNGYYILLASVMVFGMVIAGFLQGLLMKFNLKDYFIRIRALVISVLCLFLLLLPIVFVQLTQGGQISKNLSDSRSNIAVEIQAYRSNIIDFVLPPKGNPLLSVIDSSSSLTSFKNLRSNPSESMSYIGFVIIILSVIGFIMIGSWLVLRKKSTIGALDKSIARKYLLMGSIVLVTVPIFISFMFSPEVYVLGHTIVLPGKFLIEHNIAMWRVMSRFFIPLHVLMVVFASFTLWIILANSKLILKLKKGRSALIVAIVLSLVSLTAVEYWTTMHRPSFDFNNQPKAYKWLKEQSSIETIAELPMVDPLDASTTDYVTSQVYHGKKIVNIKEANDRQLTNLIGSIENPEVLDFAYNRGVQAVVVHNDICKDVSWGAVLLSDPESMICIYKFNHHVTQDGYFAKFNSGVAYGVNDKISKEATVVVMNKQIKISFVDKKFSKLSLGNVHLTAEIVPLTKRNLNGAWSVEQDGVDISSGIINTSKSDIDVNLAANKDMTLTINTVDGALNPYELGIKNLIVTSY